MRTICVDTSVIVAVLLNEPGADILASELKTSHCIASAISLVEAHLVLRSRITLDVVDMVTRFVSGFNVTVVEFNSEHLGFSRAGFDQFGKGRHPAKLNFGDCAIYATA